PYAGEQDRGSRGRRVCLCGFLSDFGNSTPGAPGRHRLSADLGSGAHAETGPAEPVDCGWRAAAGAGRRAVAREPPHPSVRGNRGHRAVLRRCHHQQRPGWRDYELESGRGAALRLYRAGGDRPFDHDADSRRPSRRRARDSGTNPQRETRRPFRNRAPVQKRHAARHLAGHFPDTRYARKHRRGIENRARYHRAYTVGNGIAQEPGGDCAIGRALSDAGGQHVTACMDGGPDRLGLLVQPTLVRLHRHKFERNVGLGMEEGPAPRLRRRCGRARPAFLGYRRNLAGHLSAARQRRRVPLVRLHRHKFERNAGLGMEEGPAPRPRRRCGRARPAFLGYRRNLAGHLSAARQRRRVPLVPFPRCSHQRRWRRNSSLVRHEHRYYRSDITDQRENQERLSRVEKLAAAGQLAASMAHEINNPLSAVTNALYLLEQDPNLDTFAHDIAATASSELARVSRIVKQNLSYYRVGAIARDLNLAGLVGESLQVFREKFERAGVELKLNLRNGRPVLGFSDEIRQVIDNLLSNAVEAMPKGGRLTVSVRDSFDWNHRQRKGVRL